MTIQIKCEKCNRKLKAPDNAVGRKAKCPNCKHILIIQDSRTQTVSTVNKPKTIAKAPRRPVSASKRCPYCNESVSAKAKKCKHCGEILDAALRSAEEARRSAENQSSMVFMNASSPTSPVNGAERNVTSGKNKISAALFAFFFGAFGFHKFYLGQIPQGILYLLFFWTFIPSFIALFEGIHFLSMDDQKFARMYA